MRTLDYLVKYARVQGNTLQMTIARQSDSIVGCSHSPLERDYVNNSGCSPDAE